jgi:hypothetical protein
MMSFNPNVERRPISPYGLADWYRYLNLGYHVPLVGGSDKMSAQMLLGGLRTYAQLGEHELTYDSWMRAVRGGDTFVTVGPLVSIAVDGIRPGGCIELPAGGGSVAIEWHVESAAQPIDAVEIVVGGLGVEGASLGGALSGRGSATVRIEDSTWIAARVRGGGEPHTGAVVAHTSAVQVRVSGRELFREIDAADVLDQIQGAIAYVDTLAPRRDARELERIRATLEGAYQRLHARLHAAGSYHRHPAHGGQDRHAH